MNKSCNTCRWQTGEKGECFKHDDCFDCPMCSVGGSCKCLAVESDSECPYWEPMKEEESDERTL